MSDTETAAAPIKVKYDRSGFGRQSLVVRNGHSNEEWKVALAKVWVNSFVHRRNCKHKGSEARTSLVYPRNREKTSVVEEEQAVRK